MSCIPATAIFPPLTGIKASRQRRRQGSTPSWQERQAVRCGLVAHCSGRRTRLPFSHPRSREEQGRDPCTLSFALPLEATASPEDGEYPEPLPGVVVFRRNAVRTHSQVATSLEKLGLKALSSDLSRGTASEMGLKSDEMEEANESFTPVVVSWDVVKEGRDLRLNGVAKTAISAICNKCLSPMAERIAGEFSLLLTHKPVEEPTQERLGVVLAGPAHAESPDEVGAGLLDLDLDDKIYFPKEALEVDISKYIRDTVHLEIPTISTCRQSCKGVCITCGRNLNNSTCKCIQMTEGENKWSALDQLKTQLREEA